MKPYYSDNQICILLSEIAAIDSDEDEVYIKGTSKPIEVDHPHKLKKAWIKWLKTQQQQEQTL